MSVPIVIGPFVVGEIPDTLEYQYLDANGAAMPISGYAATFSVREKFSDTATVDNVAAVNSDPANGKVEYAWTGVEFPTAGHYYAEFWIGNTVQRYASERIEFCVCNPVSTVPPI